MNQVIEFFSHLFDTSNWPPRWHCGKWTDFHGWLYIISDLVIWASYFAIPILIVTLLLKRTDIPFHKLLGLFCAFILLCGLTHLIDAVIFWWPAYRLSALIRFFTAGVSATTVYAFSRALPVAFTLKSPPELEKEIEERIKAESEVLKLNGEMKKRVAQLQDFAYITSHNLRSPVCSMSTLLTLYKEESSEEMKSEMMENMEKIANNLTSMLNELSDIVRISDNEPMQNETLYFEDVLKSVKENLKGQIMETGTVIKSDFSGCNFISYSSVYLESILLNLISNAIKYRSPKRQPFIRIKTELKGDEVTMVVSDNGRGIDLKQHGRKMFGLYKTFHYHPDSKGVGLFITKTQIESYGGSIKVESTPGEGSSFIIHFGEKTAI